MKNNLLLSAALVVGMWIGTTEATLAQTTTETNKSTINVLQSNPLDFAIKNVKEYYPDMENYLVHMVNNFPSGQEQKDTVNYILGKTVMNITDPKQKVAATVYFLETCIHGTSDFSDIYNDDISDATFDIIVECYKFYTDRHNNFVTRLEKHIDEIQIEIETNKGNNGVQKQDLEVIMRQFTTKDIMSNITIQRLIRKTKKIYKKAKFVPLAHTQQLFDAVKTK